MKHKALAAALGMACLAMSITAQAQDKIESVRRARAASGPLLPAEVDAIQRIGGNILVAKRGQSEDAEVTALVQEMQALAQDMDQAMAARMSAPMTATAASSTSGPAQPKTAQVLQVQSTPSYQVVMSAEGKFVSQDAIAPAASPSPPSFVPRAAIAPQPASGDSARFDPVRQRLARLEDLMQKYNTAAQTRGGAADLIRARAIGAKVAQLRDALRTFMDNPSATPDTGEQLRALQKRLHFESLNDLTRQARRERRSGRATEPERAEQPTPTMTGLTGHR